MELKSENKAFLTSVRKIVLALVLSVFVFDSLKAQVKDSVLVKKSLISFDTTAIDTFVVNKKNTDTLKIGKKNQFDKIIEFEAQDSLKITLPTKKIEIFGKGIVIVPDDKLQLSADSIGIILNKKELEAKGSLDSSFKVSGKPVFKDQDKEYYADIMRYNFETRKGIAYQVRTKEQNYYLHGEIIKIHSNDEFHIKYGKFTTCDAEHPHFYIDISKAKLISKKTLITGPLKLVIADIPIYPIVLPFGFFPLSRKNVSGIHLPEFRTENERGFGLSGFGYYWAINDHFNLDVHGEVFAKGSWGLTVDFEAKYRYLFDLRSNFGFIHFQNGPKELSTTQSYNTYTINLSYQQAPTAHPSLDFSASVNYTLGNYDKLKARDINQFVQNTQNSSISIRKKFLGTPFNLSANLNLYHNTKDSISDLSFPNINLNMANVFPFKSKKRVKNVFYEQIAISFRASFLNKVKFKDTLLFKHPDSILIKANTGFNYGLPLSTSFKVFRYINISPTFNYNGFVYFKKIQLRRDSLNLNKIVKDTTFGFYHLYDFGFSVAASTRLFGIFNLNLGRLKAIRHVMNPSISFNLKPDFSNPSYGFYDYHPIDTTYRNKYFLFGEAIAGQPSAGRQQSLSFSLSNNFEAKIKTNDTVAKYNKVSLIDQLSLSFSYNFAADSMNLSNIYISSSSNLFKRINFNFNMSFDPYTVNPQGRRINVFEFEVSKRLANLQSINLNLSSSLRSDDIWDSKSDFANFKWSVSGNYSLSYSRFFNITEQRYNARISQILNFSIDLSPTSLWSFRIISGYDIDARKLSSTSINVTRDLHCWFIQVSIIPFGVAKSYSFVIQVKDPMFDILKIKKERNWWDY